VTGFGFFVRLDDLFIDGLVHVSTLDNDYYRYDNIGQRLVGESSGQVYRLGDEVEIRVEAVHMDERKIDFALVSSTRRPRGAGKTARDKAKQGTQRDDGRGRRPRRDTKKRTNFEPDSAFRKDESGAPSQDDKKPRRSRRPTDRNQKGTSGSRSRRGPKRDNS
ncbi:MAG: S1 RNA-binding domain-containing protein, partial [Yersiniaceae bacterium]|nr:S1 RNA-binding domain-containing protein [Yersiniaceae bacterium]